LVYGNNFIWFPYVAAQRKTQTKRVKVNEKDVKKEKIIKVT
jgi:hypothetical protein